MGLSAEKVWETEIIWVIYHLLMEQVLKTRQDGWIFNKVSQASKTLRGWNSGDVTCSSSDGLSQTNNVWVH